MDAVASTGGEAIEGRSKKQEQDLETSYHQTNQSGLDDRSEVKAYMT